MIIIGLGLFAGILIGAAGIGGVILVPALVHIADIPVRSAIAAATMSFIMTGLVGTYLYAKAKSIKWGMSGWLSAGAMPAALAGAMAVSFASGALLEIVIGVLAAFSGLHTLFFSKERPSSGARSLSNGALCIIGAITGFASALTGTGGPLVLVPLLMALDCAVVTAVGLSQVVQLPVSLVATGGNFYNGSVDLRLAGLLTLGVPLGVWVGSRIALALPRQVLRRMVSVLLIAIGVLIFGKMAVVS
jgi:uncharacterized membrane protein YfcA